MTVNRLLNVVDIRVTMMLNTFRSLRYKRTAYEYVFHKGERRTSNMSAHVKLIRNKNRKAEFIIIGYSHNFGSIHSISSDVGVRVGS